MTDWSKDIASFEAAISRLAESLTPHRVVIEKKEYLPEAFHSWEIVAGTEKKKFNFFYDGQVSALRYHDASTVPQDWRDLQHASFRTWEGEDPIAFIELILKTESPARD